MAEKEKDQEKNQQNAEDTAIAEKEENTTKEQDQKKNEAHDDFDWDLENKSGLPPTSKETEELKQFYEESLNIVEENQIITGKVVSITDSDVVLNIGFKSDGLVPRSEFRDLPDLSEDDEVEVYVIQTEDERGQLVLSRRNAKLMRAWENIVDAYENDKVVKGKVISKTKGGLIADIFGLETFLPGSQIDVKPIVDYDAYVGKTMEFKVVKINEAIKNAVVSHKALIESDIEEQRQEIISKLEKGQVLEGTIKNITDFGAFIDLGGVDGLLYITDISWGRINHPSEVLELNQKLNVVVLDFDDEKKRISLGLKQLQSHPWDVLDEKLEEGSKVKGKIVNIEDYGAFLEITPGVEGLIHVSEISWSNETINPRDFFNLGDEHEAVIVTIDREERKMSLSLKRMTKDPWEEIDTKYPEESKHTGKVKNVTPFGVFVELEEGIGGMVHISDLSWTKRFQHPSEYIKGNDELDVIILDIDKENRKLTLGHKQIEEDPWDTFKTIFTEGSVHQGTIIRMEEKGAIVNMQYGLEAFAPGKHLIKEDGSQAEVEETLDFKILEFNADEKKIIVSHSRIHEDKQREEKGEAKPEKKKAPRKPSKKSTKHIEKTTLGELDVLSDLKQQMESEEKKGSKKKGTKKSEKKSSPKKDKDEDND